jgi:hypothetical protein
MFFSECGIPSVIQALSPSGVNFINILLVPFEPIFFRKKITKPKYNYRKALLYENFAHKKLMKLTPAFERLPPLGSFFL